MGTLQSEGSSGSTKLTDTRTTTFDGEETSRTVEVEIKVEGVNSNQKVVLKQMASDDRILAEEAVTKDNIPEDIDVLPNAEYMIMEEHYTDHDGHSAIKRSVMDIDEETLGVRFSTGSGMVETVAVALKKME